MGTLISAMCPDFYRPQTNFGARCCNIFTSICHSIHRGVGFPACIICHVTWGSASSRGSTSKGLGRSPQDTWDATGCGQKAGGTHFTGMLSCARCRHLLLSFLPFNHIASSICTPWRYPITSDNVCELPTQRRDVQKWVHPTMEIPFVIHRNCNLTMSVMDSGVYSWWIWTKLRI